MLDTNIKAQLAGYLARISQPVELIASLDDRDEAQQMRELLEDIVAIAPGGATDSRPSVQVASGAMQFTRIPCGATCRLTVWTNA